MKRFLTWFAYAMAIVGVWDHDYRMILASLSVYFIWPLISFDVMAEGECAGCTKGRIVPGCPIHDPQQRVESPARKPEAVPATEGKAS